ncbi:methyltransferase domain-containing protein [Actinopolymorpha alba]|uniref:methyltransferase domain-containing protein n=1 Tax=Actinopolymorpha alba TaxID=533267 RepID=UPI0004763643|nr:class I SAM-dependent methyltransferase [Actinopolymorpha alba]
MCFTELALVADGRDMYGPENCWSDRSSVARIVQVISIGWEGQRLVMDSSAEQREVWDRNAAYYSPGDTVETEAVAPTVDFLAQLAGDGPALEFAIGAGRIAVPLSRRGIPVAGIDVSPAMIDVLHATVPAAELPAIVVGSMATADAPGHDYQ